MKRKPPPLANVITLGVQNFDAQRDFYRRLGWPQAFDSGDFAVFEMRGALLALFPVDKLASDAHAQPEPGHGGIRFSIIIGVDTPEEVDELAATPTSQTRKATTGRSPVLPRTTRWSLLRVGRRACRSDPSGPRPVGRLERGRRIAPLTGDVQYAT
jgi:catechol 2,3-dioxygenase-like lactoylglutathione lyase family enzyme